MATTKLIQTNWSAGEISPKMFGRVDTAKYSNGAAQLTNYICAQQGPLMRRMGTKFIAEVKTSAHPTLIREFQFSDLQSYIIEFGDKYVRIYYDGGFVETAPSSGIPLEVTTPYAYADLAGLKFTQSADVLYIVHGSYPTQKLERLGANNWVLNPLLNLDGPYLSIPLTNQLMVKNISDTCLATSAGNIFTLPANKAITNVTQGATSDVKITCTAHGRSTGDIVAISGVVINITQYGQILESNAISGDWTITVIDANNFTLNGSTGIIPHYSPQSLTTAVVVFTGALVTNSILGVFCEYIDSGTSTFGLARVIGVLNATTATVLIEDYILTQPPTVLITFSGGQVSTNYSVFTPADVGKYIRVTDNEQWALLTGYIDPTHMAYSALTVIQYAFPANIATIDLTQRQVVVDVVSTGASFASTDIGRLIRTNIFGYETPSTISQFLSSTHVICTGSVSFPRDPNSLANEVDSNTGKIPIANGGLTSRWKLGAWSDTTGWPRCCCFHQQRLWLGGTATEPQTIWGSQSADYENFAPTEPDSLVIDSDAITYTLVDTEANPIIWMESGPVLLIGTQGGEWKINASSAIDAPITPTNIIIKPQTRYGSLANARQFRIGYAYLFAQRAGQKLFELTYSFALDSYIGKNLTVVSEHIFRKGGSALQFAYQKEPNNVLWCILTDGSFCGMTYEPTQEVTAWHSHQLGGGGKTESIACISATNGLSDLVYFVVNRTINGTTKRYIEVMQVEYYPTSPQDKINMWYVDCGQQYNGSPSSTITGLGYLEGEVVAVVADGVSVGPMTVTSGQISLTVPASVVTVGYNYQSVMGMLPLDGGSRDGGSAQGKMKGLARSVVRLYNTLGMKFGPSLDSLDELSFRDTSDELGQSPAIFTGDKPFNLPVNYGLTGQFFIVQDEPYPSTILAIMPDVEVTT